MIKGRPVPPGDDVKKLAFASSHVGIRRSIVAGVSQNARSQNSFLLSQRRPLTSSTLFRYRRRRQILHPRAAAKDAETYDVVIIGSGLGGLSAGALLSAAYGKSVCVCESHSLPGGAAHCFTRKTDAGMFKFDSGPHLFSGLSTGGGARALSANPMQHVLRAVGADLPCIKYSRWGCLFPEGYFATEVAPSKPLFSSLIGAVSGSNAQRQIADLITAMKPLCKAATALPPACLRANDPLGSLRVARRYLTNPTMLQSIPAAFKLMQPFEPFMHLYIRDPFTRNFLDLLCFLLAGVPASQIPLAEISFMFSEWTGATAGSEASDTVLEHPVGGADAIVQALVRAIEKNPSSTVRLNSHVKEISMIRSNHKSRRRASGVVLKSGEKILAKDGVISNTSYWDLPELAQTARYAEEKSSHSIESEILDMCPSFVHLHVAFEMTDEISKNLPHPLELNYVSVTDWSAGITSPQNVALISIPSVADDTLAPPNYHVVHAYAPATEPYDVWTKVSTRSEYESLKAQRTEFLRNAVEKIIPGVRSAAIIRMAGSPLTHERFLRRARGTYGPVTDARRFSAGNILPGQCRSEVAEALWSVGDSTFPGIGVPAVAASAWLAVNCFSSVKEHRDLLTAIGL